jgi:hypothetical protein
MPGMPRWFEIRDKNDPWGGRQPRYECLVKIAPGRLGLVTSLPSGERITVPLDRLALDR